MISNVIVSKQTTVPRRGLLRKEVFWVGLLFLITLSFRYHEYYKFRDFNSDKARQLHGTYWLLQGKGVIYESYNLNTFEPSTQAIIDWPPAYSYVIAGISKISGTSVYAASWILDILSLAVMWVILLWIATSLQFSLLQKTLLFTFLGLAKTPWIFYYSSDIFATVLFLLSVALNLHYIQNERKKTILFGFLQFAVIAGMCFLKYSLLPAYLSIGFSVISYAWLSKKKEYFNRGFSFLAFAVVSLALLFFYNQVQSGELTTMDTRHGSQTGPFFDNLYMFTAFLVNGIFYLDGINKKVTLEFWPFFLLLINFTIIGMVLLTILKKIIKKTADYFSHLVLIGTIAVCAFLTLLSVYYPKDVNGNFFWTYVKEFRYFSPAFFLLFLYLIKQVNLRNIQKPASLFLMVFLLLGVAFSVGLNSYYKLTNNLSGSFENMYGRIERANYFVEKNKTSQTYFVSMSGQQEVDAQACSLVAIHGTKVAMSYYGYFPDSNLSPLFSKNKTIPKDKRVILYLNQNTKLLDSLNSNLNYKLLQNQQGEKFIIIN